MTARSALLRSAPLYAPLLLMAAALAGPSLRR